VSACRAGRRRIVAASCRKIEDDEATHADVPPDRRVL